MTHYVFAHIGPELYEPAPQSESLKDADTRSHKDDEIQERFNAGGHRNVSIVDPEGNTHNDQHQNQVQNAAYGPRKSRASVQKPANNPHQSQGKYNFGEKHISPPRP